MTEPSGESATLLRYSLLELAEQMEDVISLGRGDPDLTTPPEIIEPALAELDRTPAMPGVRGLASLREGIAERYRRDKGILLDPGREILITNGAQEGLFLTILSLLNPGERILVPDPRYSSYDQAIHAAGGERVELPTGAGRNFALSPEDVAARAGDAKLLLVVNPSNPTAALIPPQQVRAIARIALESNLTVISDEIYESLIFDGEEFVSFVQCESMRERTVTLSGFSKTYAMTGFRVGYLLGPPSFIDAAARLKSAVSGPSPLFSQLVARSALDQKPEAIDSMRRVFENRRRVMMRGLDALSIPYGHPGGGFYIWADVSRFGIRAEVFCRRLLIEQRVLIFPGNGFGDRWSHYVRISLLQTEERLKQALERLGRFAEDLGGVG
jgi:aminotransferase